MTGRGQCGVPLRYTEDRVSELPVLTNANARQVGWTFYLSKRLQTQVDLYPTSNLCIAKGVGLHRRTGKASVHTK